jgi:hypothetical protein
MKLYECSHLSVCHGIMLVFVAVIPPLKASESETSMIACSYGAERRAELVIPNEYELLAARYSIERELKCCRTTKERLLSRLAYFEANNGAMCLSDEQTFKEQWRDLLNEINITIKCTMQYSTFDSCTKSPSEVSQQVPAILRESTFKLDYAPQGLQEAPLDDKETLKQCCAQQIMILKLFEQRRDQDLRIEELLKQAHNDEVELNKKNGTILMLIHRLCVQSLDTKKDVVELQEKIKQLEANAAMSKMP